jgi:SAM-dependent methyltransferase
MRAFRVIHYPSHEKELEHPTHRRKTNPGIR